MVTGATSVMATGATDFPFFLLPVVATGATADFVSVMATGATSTH